MGDPLFRETAVEIFLDDPVDLEIRVSSDRGGEVRIIVCCETKVAHAFRRVLCLLH